MMLPCGGVIDGAFSAPMEESRAEFLDAFPASKDSPRMRLEFGVRSKCARVVVAARNGLYLRTEARVVLWDAGMSMPRGEEGDFACASCVVVVPTGTCRRLTCRCGDRGEGESAERVLGEFGFEVTSLKAGLFEGDRDSDRRS